MSSKRLYPGRARLVQASLPAPSVIGKLTQYIPGTKAFDRRRFRYVAGNTFMWMGSATVTDEEIRRKIGDGSSSDVLMSTIRWIQRAAVEPPLVAVDGNGEVVSDGPLVDILSNPNSNYGLPYLISGAIFDLSTSGNAYWLCVRNGLDEPSEIEYLPAWAVTPKWDGPGSLATRDMEFITHYEYQAGGQTIDLPPEDVLHFRQGVDAQNIRIGLSPLRGLMREIYTDIAASQYTSNTLSHPIPGLMISPADSSVELPAEALEAAKRKVASGDFGGVIGLTGAVRIDTFGFSPSEIDLSSLRDVSEERVTAALGVASAVVGFGTGLQSTKVGATMREMRKLSYQNGVLPLLSNIEEEIGRVLIPQLEAEGQGVMFDTSDVDALQEDSTALSTRITNEVRSGIRTVAEARAALGLEVGPFDDIYLRNLSMIEIPRNAPGNLLPDPDEDPPEPEPDDPEDEDEPEDDAEDEGTDDEGDEGDEGKEQSAPERVRRARLIKRLERQMVYGDYEQRLIAQATLERIGVKRTITESNVIERAPRLRRAPRANARLARDVDRIRLSQTSFEDDLQDLFDRIGSETHDAAQSVIERLEIANEAETRDAGLDYETKQIENEALFEQLLFERLDLIAWQDALEEIYANNYVRNGADVVAAMQRAGISFEVTDQFQVAMLRSGGTRAGLVDLNRQTRAALFEALAEARESGLAGESLARAISEHVTAGPWSDVRTRARMIARTEGGRAANEATIEAANQMEGVERMMMHDDRTSDGPHDDECPLIDGLVVTIEQARQLIEDEHPNGTRSATPLFQQNLEDLGIE